MLTARSIIPIDGSGGAFGYGLLTDAQGVNGVIIGTSHQGINDSMAQGNENDPVWHNHFVKIAKEKPCGGTNFAISEMTFEQPGIIQISDNHVILRNIPKSFTGTDSFARDPLTISPGNNVQQAISFKLHPILSKNG